MMKQEFEQIAGYEVSYEDYISIIEPMYLAVPESVTKQEFAKMIDKKRFALKPISKIVKEMRKCAESLKETCTHYTDFETKEKLENLVNEYIARRGLEGIACYHITDEQIFSCYYPKTVSIFSEKTYKTFETIELA